jgi:hypothetical protein
VGNERLLNIVPMDEAQRRRRADSDEWLGAELCIHHDALETLANAQEDPGASKSRLYFERLGRMAARRLYINAAKAGWLDGTGEDR